MARRLGVLLVLIQQGRAAGGDGERGELPGLWETRIAQLCFRDHTAGPKVQAKDKFWTSLSEAERAAAGALGWSAGGWDDGDPGPLERKYWRVAQGQAEALSDAEKEHAELLGHSPRSWDHGMADNRLLSAVEGSLLEAVEQERPAASGWGRSSLRGLLTAPQPPQIEGLGEMRVWAEEALTHYLRAMHAGGGAVTTLNISDSWASVGRPENWAGAASQTLRSSDIVGHLFLSCPGPGGTCKMEMGDPRPRAETVLGKQFKASLLSRTKAHTIARSVRLMGGCAVLHPGWMEHYHYHEPVSVHGPDEGMASRSADAGPPRLWLSFTAQVLSHTADPTAKGLRVEVANPRQPGLAKVAQPPLAEEPIRPQLDRLWASPITVLPRDKRKSQRKKLRAARDSVLGFAERMPSRSLSNFGGWQSEANLFSEPETANAPGIPRVREMVEAALERYLLALAGPGATGEVTVEIFASWANVNAGHSWNSPHSHDGDLSGALYLSCPGEPCVITLLDPRVAAVAGPEELLGSGTIAFNRAQGVGDVVQQLEEGEVLIFPTWVEHHVPPLPKPRAKRGKGKRKGTEESSPRISISFNSRVLRVEEGEAPLRVRFEPPPPKSEL